MGNPAYSPIDSINGYPPEAVKDSAQNFSITFLESLPEGTQRPTIVLSWDDENSVGKLAFEDQNGAEMATASFSEEGTFLGAATLDPAVADAVEAAVQEQLRQMPEEDQQAEEEEEQEQILEDGMMFPMDPL